MQVKYLDKISLFTLVFHLLLPTVNGLKGKAMIKCIAMWNFKTDTTHRAIDEVTFKFLELKKLDEVLELSVLKSNIKSSTKDYCLLVTLLNERDLQQFLNSAPYKEVAALAAKEFCKFETFHVEY